MGEQADYLLDSIFEATYGDNPDGCITPPLTCFKCGAANISWRKRRQKWALVGAGGELHVCPLDSITAEILADFQEE